MHARVAERLREEPHLVERARGRVDDWASAGKLHERYAAEWRRLLALPIEQLCAFLVDPGEHARAMRQTSPFTGVLDPKERWQILREVTTHGGNR